MKISSVFSRFLVVVTLLLAGLNAYAQNSFNVTLKLADEKTGEPVSFPSSPLSDHSNCDHQQQHRVFLATVIAREYTVANHYFGNYNYPQILNS